MYYNLLLHQNIKHYGVVSLSSTMSISLSELLKSPKPNIQEKYSLDTLIIYSKHMGTNIPVFCLFNSFSPKHLDISYNIWGRIEIDSSIDDSINADINAGVDIPYMDSVTIRDIHIDYLSVPNTSSASATSSAEPTGKVASNKCITNMLKDLYYSHRNLLSCSYPSAEYLHLYFAYYSPFTLTQSHIYALMFISSFIFFNASYLTINLPAHTAIDVFSIQQQTENIVPSQHLKQFMRKSIMGFYKSFANSFITKSNRNSNLGRNSFYSIIFKQHCINAITKDISPFYISLMALYDTFYSSGYILAFSGLNAFTITNRMVSCSLHVLDEAFLSIFFENRDHSLSFRKLGYLCCLSQSASR